MRLAVVVGIVMTVMLVIPITYGSYIAPRSTDDAVVKLVVVENMSMGNASLPRILGTSIDWPDNANGLYNDVSQLLNPTPVSELIGLHPNYLRFPATRLSQVYDWTKGVGTSSERAENPTHGPKPQPSTFGTDEFYKLVDHTDTQAVMVVNANDGSPEMARNWVSYCNDPSYLRMGRERAANGYSTPYGIEDWEIGYEPYLPTYWRDKPVEADAGMLYAERVNEFSLQMKTIDPTIKVGAWMVLDPDTEHTCADDRWNLNFLNKVGNKMWVEGFGEVDVYDYVVVKVELPAIPVLLNHENLYTYSYAEVWKSLREDLALLRGLIEANTPPNRSVPLAIAAFGPDFTDEGWNTHFPACAGSALITADMVMQVMNIALEDGERMVKYACYGELNTPSYQAMMINPDFEGAHLDSWGQSPNYLAFQLCTRLQEGVPLTVSEIDPLTFDVSTERELPGIKNVPLVSGLATGDFESETITLMLVNRDIGRSVECRLSVDVSWMPGLLDVRIQPMRFDSLLSDNLVEDSVTAPFPPSKETRRMAPDEVSLTLPPGTMVLVTLEHAGVS